MDVGVCGCVGWGVVRVCVCVREREREWPDWAIFESYWEQNSMQKQSKYLAIIFWAIVKNCAFYDKTFWATFGENWATLKPASHFTLRDCANFLEKDLN